MRHNYPIQVDMRKGYGTIIGLVSSCFPSTWIAFTLALTVTALKSSYVGISTNTGCETGRPIYSLWQVWILSRLSHRL